MIHSTLVYESDNQSTELSLPTTLFVILWIFRPQIHIMELVKKLGLEVYQQYSDGAKFVRLSDGKIRKYTTSIPCISPVSLIDIHFLLNKVCTEAT